VAKPFHRRSRKQFRREGQTLAPSGDVAGKNVNAFRRVLRAQFPPVPVLSARVNRRDGIFSDAEFWQEPGRLTRRLREKLPPLWELRGRHWRYGERHMRAPMAKHYAEARGLYRVFNAAVYRFYRKLGSIPEPGVDSPFATHASLPHTPSDTWADGTWYTCVTYFDGVVESNPLPIGPNGETALRLDISGGQSTNEPPQEPQEWQIEQRANGVVRVKGAYVPFPDDAGGGRATEWAICYTTDGSAPTPGSPQVTQTMDFGPGYAWLQYDLPAQSHGTTVRVLLQSRRNDGSWVYSENTADESTTADAQGPSVPGMADRWPGALPEDL
jgi:hypothetical protein